MSNETTAESLHFRTPKEVGNHLAFSHQIGTARDDTRIVIQADNDLVLFSLRRL